MKALALVIAMQCGTLLCCAEARAEGGCPLGMVPFQFAPTQPPTCMPGAGDQRALPEEWSNRFGAVAADSPRDILGTAVNMTSERDARDAALGDCKAKGGTQCQIERPYRNGCTAVTIGDPDGINFAADPVLQDAIDSGMKTCTKAGAKNCRTSYGACSFPERIQRTRRHQPASGN